MSHPILYISKLTKNSKWVPPLPNFSFLFTLLLLPFHTTFTPLSLFYTLKIDGSRHFTHFSFSFPLLYTYFLTSVPKPNVKNWVGRREYNIGWDETYEIMWVHTWPIPIFTGSISIAKPFTIYENFKILHTQICWSLLFLCTVLPWPLFENIILNFFYIKRNIKFISIIFLFKNNTFKCAV